MTLRRTFLSVPVSIFEGVVGVAGPTTLAIRTVEILAKE